MKLVVILSVSAYSDALEKMYIVIIHSPAQSGLFRCRWKKVCEHVSGKRA